MTAPIRRRLPRPGDKWHLDEVVLKIAGKKHWVWRAVDQDGLVLDIGTAARLGVWVQEGTFRLVDR